MEKLIFIIFLSAAACRSGMIASAEAEVFPEAFPFSGSQDVHQRFKRDWIWNRMHIQEEMTSQLPHHVGKITSSVNSRNARYVLKGPEAGKGKLFRVNEQTGDVYAFERLDREKKSEYCLTAYIVDKDTNMNLEPPSNFTIKVHDVNDNAPEFAQRVFNGSVPEMSAVGTSVTRVTAVDADDPTVLGHAIVSYNIIQGRERFTIDNSGTIFTAVNNLDREKQSKYEIVVGAKDGPGLHGDSSTATVVITLSDINDNFPIFTETNYKFVVPEDIRVGSPLGSLTVEDPDEPQNRMTKYSIVQGEYRDTFVIELDASRNQGIIKPIKPLDYEHIKEYSFTIEATDPTINLRYLNHVPSKNLAVVHINVTDVDEPPVFSQRFYHFELMENLKKPLIGTVFAKDPDATQRNIGYSIRKTSDRGQFFRISPTGSISNTKELDREIYPWYNLTIEAKELDRRGVPTGQESIVQVHIEILDENDNPPEIAQPNDARVCENAAPGTLVTRILATDKDVTPRDVKFRYYLSKEDSNFTLIENRDNSANITVKYGQFDRERAKVHYLPVVVADNGKPSLTGTSTLVITVCKCNDRGEPTFCEEPAKQVGVSIQALVAIFLCILTIVVITVLIVLRRRLRKQDRAQGKNVAEIHEQLVTYDEEGGGEMDTNSYDVSVLNSACKGSGKPPGGKPPRPALDTRPSLYAQIQKPPRPVHPQAVTGEMAVMIEVKKDEADHDDGGPPYDTLHIYGYEGAESIAESLSSLVTDSSDSDVDYDFLNDWGPRFKMLAELYGTEPIQDLVY